jgi:hypothetical protein
MTPPIYRLGLLALLTLAACAQPATVQRSAVFERPLAQRGLDYAGARGPVLLTVVGDPFAQGLADRDTLALAALRRALGGTGIELTTDPTVADRPDFRLVLLLAPEEARAADATCAEPAAVPTRTAGEEILVRAIFCDGTEALGVAEGTGVVAGADDAAYTRLMRQTVQALFPDLHRARVDRWHDDRWYGDRWYAPFHFGLGLGIRI